MDKLSCVILEGAIKEVPVINKNIFPESGRFVVETSRSSLRNGEFVTELSQFTVYVYGDAMVDNAVKHCTVGRGVRLVVRLKQNKWSDSDGKKHSEIVVIAEHLEFKPAK